MLRLDHTNFLLMREIGETGSITRAAEKTHLAVSSASERIRHLEADIGVQLLERNRRGSRLTSAGACFADHARLVLTQLASMSLDLSQYAKGLHVKVRIASNTSAIDEHLPAMLLSFLKTHPAIDIEAEELESSEIVAAVAAGHLDLGIAFEAAVSPGVRSTYFCDDRLVVVGSAFDANLLPSSGSLAGLADRSFVGLLQSAALQRHVEHQASRAGLRLNMRARVNSFDEICRLAAGGVGVGVVPEIAANRSQNQMPLRVMSLTDPWALRRLMLCTAKSSRHSTAVALLVHHLVGSRAELASAVSCGALPEKSEGSPRARTHNQ